MNPECRVTPRNIPTSLRAELIRELTLLPPTSLVAKFNVAQLRQQLCNLRGQSWAQKVQIRLPLSINERTRLRELGLPGFKQGIAYEVTGTQ